MNVSKLSQELRQFHSCVDYLHEHLKLAQSNVNAVQGW